MRVLLTFTGGGGHLEPLVPVAAALRAAGHEVAFAAPSTMTGEVERRGYTAFAAGGSEGVASAPVPLRAPSDEREDRVLREVFAGSSARERAVGVFAVGKAWRPDVLVREELDFGGAVAAERLGLPCATMLVNAAGSFVRRELVAEPLAALRAEHGLPADPLEALRAEHGLPADPSLRADQGLPAEPSPAWLHGALVLSPFPPSLRDPAFPLPPGAVSVRLRTAAPPEGDGAVYLTLGTIFGPESGDLLARALAGLAELGREVIATVGRHLDPAALGPVPAHVRVERYVDQWLVLPRCAAVVSHAGSGTVLGALAHGLPSVLLPLGADQLHNARRCAAAGVGRVLDPVGASPADIRRAVEVVLRESAAAERMRDELNALPGVDHAVGRLERLASHSIGSPLVGTSAPSSASTPASASRRTAP